MKADQARGSPEQGTTEAAQGSSGSHTGKAAHDHRAVFGGDSDRIATQEAIDIPAGHGSKRLDRDQDHSDGNQHHQAEHSPKYGHTQTAVSMYWYMRTTTSSRALLTDETWAQIPRTRADRRAVGVAFLVLVLLLATIIVGNTTGILVPRLTYEGGSTAAANAHTHKIIVRAIVHNNSARSWKVTGATINAPGTVHDIHTTPVSIPAHETRTVVGVIQVDNCTAIPSAPNQTNPSYDIKLSVERLLGVSTVMIHGVFDDQLRIIACGG